jgi:hypothetical protein
LQAVKKEFLRSEEREETIPNQNALKERGEPEFEEAAQDDNSLGDREQEREIANMESSPPIKSDAHLWPERFADGKSDITFDVIPSTWSFSNQVKSWIENKTQTIIIWWPLAPRRRPLQPNCAQVTWTCVSSYVADLYQLSVS